MSDQTCKNCKFYQPETAQCHRHPPAIGRRGRFPNVQLDDWCGEFVSAGVLARVKRKKKGAA